MFEFKILKKSAKSRARLGILKTDHGAVETPAFVPVATGASVKTLVSEDIFPAKSQILIANTFHLHLRPGEKIVKAAGGLSKFMNWLGPTMTDSGGFQVFSLGFGREYGLSKVTKKGGVKIEKGRQPRLLKISDDGVLFTSFIDGAELFLGPKESIKIQADIGADINFAFDECPPPSVDYDYMKKSLARTHRWAEICLKSKKSEQILYGIVQGGGFADLRKQSASFIGSLDFDGFGIGGEFGADKKDMSRMLKITLAELPEKKPRHLLGIGYPEDMIRIVKEGVDTFDCTVPTHFARHGVAFTSAGRSDLSKKIFLTDKKPLDSKCACATCRGYSRSYLSHLFRAKEITGLRLLTFHNLFFFNSLAEKIREAVRQGKL
jgi:queuine tRNA-ribosyltransferase